MENPSVEVFIEAGKKPAGQEEAEKPAEVAERDKGKSRRRLTLSPVPGSTGSYSGIFRTSQAGQYQVSLGDEAKSFFEVVDIYSERDDLSPDFKTLAQVSELSKGRFFNISPEL